MEIVKQNVNDQIARLIFNSTVRSLNDLLQLCRRAEKLLSERTRKSRIGRVNEIEEPKETSNLQMHYSVNLDSSHDQLSNEEVEAIGNIRHDTSKYRCYNCEMIGHSYIECTKERRIFCYRCGKVGYVTPNCPKCQSSGNVRTTTQNPGAQQIRKLNLEN